VSPRYKSYPLPGEEGLDGPDGPHGGWSRGFFSSLLSLSLSQRAWPLAFAGASAQAGRSSWTTAGGRLRGIHPHNTPPNLSLRALPSCHCEPSSEGSATESSGTQSPCPLLRVVEAATHLPTTIPTKVGIQNNSGQYLFGLHCRTLIRILIRTSSNRKHRASLTASTLNLSTTKMDCFHTSWCRSAPFLPVILSPSQEGRSNLTALRTGSAKQSHWPSLI